MSKSKHVQIISCGPGLSEINQVYGRSCDWTYEIVAGKIPKIKIVNIYKGELPSINSDSAWIILGSRYSVYSDIDWINPFKNHIKKGINSEIPMLGICFGHQILCSALGGQVIDNHKGWEIGSSTVSLTEDGQKSKLFQGFDNNFSVYESHHDTVIDLPENIDILAENYYGLQSFSYLDFIFGVQFHPEFSFDVMKAYYSARTKKVKNKKKYFVESQNEGVKVIDNFMDIILRR